MVLQLPDQARGRHWLTRGQRPGLPAECGRCSGPRRPGRSLQQLLDVVGILALEPAAQKKELLHRPVAALQTKPQLECVRKGLQPPLGGTDSAPGFICEASELLPTPSSSRPGTLPGAEGSAKTLAFCDQERPNTPVFVVRNKPPPPKALAGSCSLRRGRG